MNDGPMRNPSVRPVFAVIATVIVAGLAFMIGAVVVGLSRADAGKPFPSHEPLHDPPPGAVRQHYFTNVIFVDDGAAVRYQLIEVIPTPKGPVEAHDEILQSAELEPVKSDVPAPAELGATSNLMKKILERAGVIDTVHRHLAISPRGMDVVFTVSAETGNTLVRRRPDGRYEDIFDHPLGEHFKRLNRLAGKGESLEARLASPDAWVWLDAALEWLLRHGPSIHPVARRVRTVRGRMTETGTWLGLLDDPDALDTVEEAVALGLECGDDPAIGTQLRGVYLMRTKESLAAFATKLCEAGAPNPPAPIKAWLLRSIESVDEGVAASFVKGLGAHLEPGDIESLRPFALRGEKLARRVATGLAQRALTGADDFAALTDETVETWWAAHPPK